LIMNENRYRQVLNGVVVSNAMDKTVVVEVSRRVKHPVYKKYIKIKKKFFAHDENNSCQVNDKVRIKASRALSKKKRWRVSEVVSKDSQE